MGLTLDVVGAVIRARRAVTPPTGTTVSNSSPTTATFAVSEGADWPVTVSAATADAAAIVRAADSTPIGAIEGPPGSSFSIPIPTGASPIYLTWAGSSAGSLTFTSP